MAPIPKDAEGASNEAIRTLVSLIVSSSEFNPDYNVVAAEVGISHAKNVPRKLDSILKPYGYHVKNKRVIKIGDAAPPTPAKTPAKTKVKAEPKTPGGSDTDQDSKDGVDVSPVKKRKTPAKTPKKEKKTPAKKATTFKPASKKRKIDEVMSDGEEDESAKDVKAKNDDDTVKETKENSGDSEEEGTTGENGVKEKDTPMEDHEDEEEAE